MIRITHVNASFVRLIGDWDDKKTISDYFTKPAYQYWFHPKYKTGEWDGKIRFFNLSSGHLALGLLSKLSECCDKHKIEVEIDDTLFDIIEDEDIDEALFNKSLKFLNPAYNPKDEKYIYQYNSALESLKVKRGTLEHCTGSGKTLLLWLIINFIVRTTKKSKVLIVVPTTGLIKQFFNDFVDYGFDYEHLGVYSGKTKDTDKKITIGTWQSLHKNKKFLKDITHMFGDEAHGQKAMVTKSLTEACINADFRIACTGSLPDEECDRLTIEGSFGPVISTVKSKELIDSGVLSPISVKQLNLHYPPIALTYLNNVKNDETNKNRKYKAEKKVLQNYGGRKNLVRKLIKLHKNENILLLFDEKAFGKVNKEYLEEKFPDRIIYYVDGDIDVDVREEIRLKTNEQDNVLIIASLGTFSTGININKLHSIIFLWVGKSSIRLKQSIGRGLRLHESKDKIVIYDIVDQLKYSKKHAIERIKIYMKEQFPVKIYDIEYKEKKK